MDYSPVIQSALDDIDKRITESIRAVELAYAANYSVYHFCRVFSELTGTPVSAYIARRKLEYALYELSKGRKIIEVAAEYGFETHAGFTKAFKKCFGCPPSLYRLHMPAKLPEKATVADLKSKYGGIKMQVEIKEIKPFVVVGYASRHEMPGLKGIADITPAFWDKIAWECNAPLTTLHDTYVNSHHYEVCMCLDIDDKHDFFTYLISVGVDEADCDVPQRPGTYRHQIQGGLYAVFTTPWVNEDEFSTSIKETWNQILNHWLPKSQYEYDDRRVDYEYYDERDHSDTNAGKQQMDICIPIRIIK